MLVDRKLRLVRINIGDHGLNLYIISDTNLANNIWHWAIVSIGTLTDNRIRIKSAMWSQLNFVKRMVQAVQTAALFWEKRLPTYSTLGTEKTWRNTVLK